jgi:hypothetical protein
MAPRGVSLSRLRMLLVPRHRTVTSVGLVVGAEISLWLAVRREAGPDHGWLRDTAGRQAVGQAAPLGGVSARVNPAPSSGSFTP